VERRRRPEDAGYTPRARPAEQILRSFYRRVTSGALWSVDMEGEPTDETLMIAYLAETIRRSRACFGRLAPAVHAFFLRAFGSRAVADDLMQTTFLKLHRARASGKAIGG